METLTVARIGQEKVIEFTNKKTGQPDSFKKVGVLTNEYGDRWMDISYRGEVPVAVGKQYEFEVSEREYQNKAGETKTAWELKLPRKSGQGGASALEIAKELYQLGNTDRVLMNRKLDAIWTKLGVIESKLGSEPLAKEFNTPEEAGITPEDEINPEDIPF